MELGKRRKPLSGCEMVWRSNDQGRHFIVATLLSLRRPLVTRKQAKRTDESPTRLETNGLRHHPLGTSILSSSRDRRGEFPLPTRQTVSYLLRHHYRHLYPPASFISTLQVLLSIPKAITI